jgi:phosphoglycerol transferase MdoB-like AlkP superfamily enzyme
MGLDALVHIVIYLIVVGCVIGLLLYLVSISPVPEPFKSWLWFFVVAVAVLIVIFYILLPLAGAPPAFHLGK